MRELIYTSSREVAKGHNVQRTVTEHHLRDTETGELIITKTTTFKCACGENELEGSVSMDSYQEHHTQLMEEAQ
jgi:hypothetical protein